MDLLTSETRRVWIPNHPTFAYVPGRVEETKDDGTLVVVDDEGGTFNLPAAEAQSVDPACLQGVDDLLALGDFNEAALLHNIRVRYSQDKIYTSIGMPILISVNPYTNIPGLYSSEKQRQYRQASAQNASNSSMPVHLYCVADAAYKTMLNERANQSIIISGESGAGKTEATKRILAYLAEMQKSTFSAGQAGDVSPKRTVEQQVLDANPVLEAFGNAKTVRNDNSSRFGKFVEVEFDSSGRLLCAQISNYLLEKCRIVTQQSDERNYHIFYNLCAGVSSSSDLAEKLQLRDAEDFEYTKVCCSIPGVDDSDDFAQILNCMVSLGFTREERNACFQIVAAVLHLGELPFASCTRDNNQDGVKINDEAHAALICDLLGIEVQQLHSVLEHKTLEDPLTKKTIHMPHDVQSASYTRHSMAKVAYARLFDWLVHRINESISGEGKGRKDLRRIGLLDIYGFEVFEWNSFEQLCINFANEKLQQHFNMHMFTEEQKLYSSEGISWSHITWQDNQHIIESLEKKPLGLFCLVDGECIMPNATDNTLLQKVYKEFKNSKIIYKPGRFQSTDFAVAHYAGEVVYNVETFLEKNTDKLHADVVNLYKSSKLDLLKKLFTDPKFAPEAKDKDSAAGGTQSSGRNTARRMSRSKTGDLDNPGRGKMNVTVSMMFREQLDKLVEDLNKTNPRYVRCIKPNAHKQPREFDSVDVLRQLRCAGMLECIRIRKAGYAVRRPFKDFFTRFRLLAPHLAATGASPDYRSLCQKLVTEVEQRLEKKGTVLEEKAWQCGQSRIFMKEELERHFESLLVDSAKTYVIRLQRRWRCFAQRKRYKALRKAAIEVQSALRMVVASATYQELRRQHTAASVVQSTLRSVMLRAVFVRRRRAAVCIQSRMRGWRVRRRLGELKSKAAADKIRKLQEEEERNAALQRARAEAKEKEQAMEQMRREMEAMQLDMTQQQIQRAQEAPVQREPPAEAGTDVTSLAQLQEENRKLRKQLEIAEAAADDSVAAMKAATASAEERMARVQELTEENADLRKSNDGLKRNLFQASIDRDEADRQAQEATRQMQIKDRLLQEVPQGPGGLPSHGAAAALLGAGAAGGMGNHALDTLRSEILARIGPQELGEEGVEPGHALGTSLRSVQPPLGAIDEGRAPQQVPLQSLPLFAGKELESPSKLPGSARSSLQGRNTLMNQRELFEQLKQNFAEAQEAQDPDAGSLTLTLGAEEIRQLEEELRHLQLENAELRTTALSKQEELMDKSNENANLLQNLSRTQAELEDLKYSHKGDLAGLRQQREETIMELKAQTEDMRRLTNRAQEAEEKAERAEKESRQRQEQMVQLEKGWLDLDRQNSALLKERAEAQHQAVELDVTRPQEMAREREKLIAEIRAKENEVGNLKRVLDDVMSAHAPMEEVKKWKTLAQTYEQQYHQAMRYNREMTSAVGHMTQAASEKGGEWEALQRQNQALEQDKAKKDQELKMVELEKQDLQQQLNNLQSSGDYFQKKYKAKTEELRRLEKEYAVVVESMNKRSQQEQAMQREYENVRHQAQTARQQAGDCLRETATRMQVAHECLNSLVTLHGEQVFLYEQAYGQMQDGDLRRASQEKRDRAHGIASRLKALIMQEVAGASAAPAAPTGNSDRSRGSTTGGLSLQMPTNENRQPSTPSAGYPAPQNSQPRGGTPSPPGVTVQPKESKMGPQMTNENQFSANLRPEVHRAIAQMDAQQGQQDPGALPINGRASLLTQLNLKTRPGFGGR